MTTSLLQVLFTMGSPVGLFMHTSDKIPNRSYTLPEGSLGLHWKWDEKWMDMEREKCLVLN